MTPHFKVGCILAIIFGAIVAEAWELAAVIILLYTIACIIHRRFLCYTGFHATDIVLLQDNKGNYGHTLACKRKGCGWVQEL